MVLNYERGSDREPKGHAILYFRDRRDPERVAATYLIALPIEMQIAKYIPPMFASRMPPGEVKALAAMPLPPVPEVVPSYGTIERLAELRADDLIAGGTADLDAPEQLMALASEAAQRYYQAYVQYVSDATSEPPERTPAEDLDVQEVLYSLYSEADKVAEVAKLVGRIRYAVEGRDERQVDEAEADLLKLAKHLPPTYRLNELASAARRPGPTGQRLSELFVERCYRLQQENFDGLPELDREIEALLHDAS